MSSLKVLVIEYCNLRFICNLVIGICIFRLKTLEQNHSITAKTDFYEEYERT
jgi:hypothetical protein